MNDQFVNFRTVPCVVCKKDTVIKLPASGFEIWKQSRSIDIAFPGMPNSERELLISGIHSECWDKMMADEESDE